MVRVEQRVKESMPMETSGNRLMGFEVGCDCEG